MVKFIFYFIRIENLQVFFYAELATINEPRKLVLSQLKNVRSFCELPLCQCVINSCEVSVIMNVTMFK